MRDLAFDWVSSPREPASRTRLRDLRELRGFVVGAAALLAAWGVFVRLNRTVEELEPEGIDEARGEDHKLQE